MEDLRCVAFGLGVTLSWTKLGWSQWTGSWPCWERACGTKNAVTRHVCLEDRCGVMDAAPWGVTLMAVLAGGGV